MIRLTLTLVLAGIAQLSACGGAGAIRDESEDSFVYVASRRGTVYYWIGCDNWTRIAEHDRVWFRTEREAEASGLRASEARGCAGPERRAGPTPLETGVCTIERVVDGDTVSCAEAAERIRLVGIDAPELAQGVPGEGARQKLAELLPVGTAARLEPDVQARDRYGRILAYLYTAEGRMVNEVLVREGHAVVSVVQPNVRHVERLRGAAEEARAEGRGIWAEGGLACAPADHRAGRCR